MPSEHRTPAVLELLDVAWPDPVRPRDLMRELGLTRKAAHMLLVHQVRRGRAERIAYGRYRRIMRPFSDASSP